MNPNATYRTKRGPKRCIVKNPVLTDRGFGIVYYGRCYQKTRYDPTRIKNHF